MFETIFILQPVCKLSAKKFSTQILVEIRQGYSLKQLHVIERLRTVSGFTWRLIEIIPTEDIWSTVFM